MTLETEARPPRRLLGAGRRIAAATFVAALVVRLLAVLLLPGALPERNDKTGRYDPIAASLLAGEGFALDGEPTALAPPAYPLLLAAVYVLTGGPSDLAPRLVLAGIDATSAALVAWLAFRLFGGRAALVAGVAAALLPYTVYQVLMAGSDTLFLALHAGFLVAVTAAWTRGRLRTWAAAGAVLGAATLCRAVPLLLPVGIAALVLVADRAPARRRIARAGVFLVVFAATLAPWTVRNWLVFDRLVPIQALGGVHLLMATGRGAPTVDEPAAPRPDESVLERDRRHYRLALERIADDPRRFLRRAGRRQVEMWSRTHSDRYEAPLLAANLLLLALAAAGLALADRRWRLLPLLAVVLYYVALHTVLIAIFRYLLPVVPVLLVLAAVPPAAAIERIGCGRRGPAPPPAA